MGLEERIGVVGRDEVGSTSGGKGLMEVKGKE